MASHSGALLSCDTTQSVISNIMLQSYHCHHDLVTECMIANTGQHDIVDNVSNIIINIMTLCWRFNYALTLVGGVSLKDSAALWYNFPSSAQRSSGQARLSVYR